VGKVTTSATGLAAGGRELQRRKRPHPAGSCRGKGAVDHRRIAIDLLVVDGFDHRVREQGEDSALGSRGAPNLDKLALKADTIHDQHSISESNHFLRGTISQRGWLMRYASCPVGLVVGVHRVRALTLL